MQKTPVRLENLFLENLLDEHYYMYTVCTIYIRPAWLRNSVPVDPFYAQQQNVNLDRLCKYVMLHML